MKAFKKLNLGAAVLLSLAVMLTGCGGTEQTAGTEKTTTAQVQTTAQEQTQAATEPTLDISKEVKLKMYLIGDKPTDTDAVYAEVNNKLKQDINATVDVNFLNWAEYEQKYPLLFASGEEFDLIYSASWIKYKDQASKDGFMALDEEMIRKYAPKTFADVPAEAWNQTKLNGKVFMIPYTKKEYSSNVAVIRGDLREKYGLPEIKSMDDVEKYLGTVKEKESGIIPWADMNFNQAYRLASLFVYTPYYYSGIAGSQECYYNRTENTGKVYTYLDEQFYNVMLEGFKKTNDWFKKGFWSKSALTTKGGTCDQLKAGKGAFAVDNYTNVQAILDEMNKNHPDWKPEAYNLNFSKYTFVSSYISNGMSIHATSKNPERALMMIELFRNDQSYFDLTTYGIKGKHYDLNADGKLLAGPDQKNFAADGACPWGWRTSLYRKNASASQSLIDIEAQFDKTAFIPPISGFSANTESIKTELAAVTNINSQYYQTLSLGVDNNVEARLKEYVEKLKAAGFEKVVSTIQTQMDEFVKTLVK